MVGTLDFHLDGQKTAGSWVQAYGWSLQYCVVPLTKKISSHCVSSPRCINGYWQHTTEGNPAMD